MQEIVIIIIIIIIILMNLRTEVYLKNAFLFTSLPHIKWMRRIYKMTKRIYAKPIRMHVKWHMLTYVCDTALSRSLWHANCKVRTWKKECVRLDSGGQCVTDSSTGTIRHYVCVCGGVHKMLSLCVTGFWDVTSHTVTQIYRRFGWTS